MTFEHGVRVPPPDALPPPSRIHAQRIERHAQRRDPTKTRFGLGLVRLGEGKVALEAVRRERLLE